MKITHILAAGVILITANAFAEDESAPIIFKLRGNYSSIDTKLTNLPTARIANPQNPGQLFSSAYGVEGSATFFVTDNIAGEFASGLNIYKAKGSAIAVMTTNYATTAQPDSKKRNMYVIPSCATIQYHIAPYGAIRPYVGAGYHYTYVMPRAKQYKVNNGGGAVFQGGVDIVLKDDTYINLDAKYFLLKTKVKFNQGFATDNNGNQINGSMKLNPLMVGLGIGFKL